jgi:hypothetical protein
MTKKMPTATAEKVYDVLCKFSDAVSSYAERETFIFHFGVLSNTSSDYVLTCMDGARRTFFCKKDGRMWVDGQGVGRTNSILRKISEEMISKKEIDNSISSAN